ncbi:MAG: cyclic nucleotide-binding domain-containing protein [Devosia sp.]
MASLLALTKSQTVRPLIPGQSLITAGEQSGELYVLETGKLAVIRDGVTIATISEPGALIGEMSVLLGIDHSATVRAETEAQVRVIDDPIAFLERQPLAALHVATLACARLNATSALLVELRKENEGKTSEQGLLSRIFNAMVVMPEKKAGQRWAAHE